MEDEAKMSVQSWLIYLTLVLVATSTPGPAVLFIMTNSTLHGWGKATFSALGNILGLFSLGLLAVTGLGAVIETSMIVFNVIKYSGAAYLIFIGCKLFFQKDLGFDKDMNQTVTNTVSSKKIFFQAFGVAVSNPKAIVFLTALFPQFIDTNTPLLPQFSILIVVLMVFFMPPIFYPITAVPEKYRLLLGLNPLCPIVENFRNAIIWGGLPNASSYLALTGFSLLVCIAGYAWFMKSKGRFADLV